MYTINVTCIACSGVCNTHITFMFTLIYLFMNHMVHFAFVQHMTNDTLSQLKINELVESPTEGGTDETVPSVDCLKNLLHPTL